MEKRDPALARDIVTELAAGGPVAPPTRLPFRNARSRFITPTPDDGAGIVLTSDPAEAHATGALAATRAVMPSEQTLDELAAAGFDLVVLDPGGDELAIERLPALIATARTKLPWVGAVVDDRRTARVAVVGHAAQLVRAGAELLWVTSAGDGNARLPAAPLADRLRNELGVATCVDADDASLSDLDAAIAAGRADLVVVKRVPAQTRDR